MSYGKRISNTLSCVPRIASLRQQEDNTIRLICRTSLISLIIIGIEPIAYYDLTDSSGVLTTADAGMASFGDVEIMAVPPGGTGVYRALDLSGHGNDLLYTGATPPVTETALGFAGLRFSGVDGCVMRCNHLSGSYAGFSTYMVLRNMSPSTPSLVTMSIGDTGNPSTGNNGFAIQQDGSSNWDVAARTGDANPYRKGGAIPAGGHVLSAIHNFTAGTLDVTIAGSTTSDTGGGLTSASPTKICLGGRTDVDTTAGNFIVAALVIFGRALSAAENTAVLNELRTLYSVT